MYHDPEWSWIADPAPFYPKGMRTHTVLFYVYQTKTDTRIETIFEREDKHDSDLPSPEAFLATFVVPF